MPNHSPEPWESRYTPGPWQYRSAPLRGEETYVITTTRPDLDRPAEYFTPFEATVEGCANASRIVACVNALAGLNPAAVPDLIAACRYYLQDGVHGDKESLLMITDAVLKAQIPLFPEVKAKEPQDE